MAMRVPEINEQFRYKSAQVPGARLQGMNVQTSADMFGAQSGRDMEKAGYMVQYGANKLSHLVDDYNTTKARDSARQMQQGFLEWQSEAQKKQGEAGMNTAADYDTWAKTKREELTKDLSDVQRGRFEALAGTQMAAQRHWASGYGTQQEQTYKKATWQAEISTAADTLATNIQNPELAQQAMEQIKDAAFTMGKHMGIGDQATQELMRTSVQKALAPAIHARIQSGELGLASALMKQYEGSLGGAAAAQLGAEWKRERKSQEAEARANAAEATYNKAETLANGLYGSVENGELSNAEALLQIRNIKDPKLQAHARSSYMQRLQIAEISRKETVARGYEKGADDFDRTGNNMQEQYDLVQNASRAALLPGATEEQKAYARSLKEQYKMSTQFAEDGIRTGSNPAAYDAVTNLVYGGADVPDLKKTEYWSQLSPTAKRTFEKAIKEGQQVSQSELTRLYNIAYSETEGTAYTAKNGNGDREIFIQRSLEKIRDTKRGNEPKYLQSLVDEHFMEATKPRDIIWDISGKYGQLSRTEGGALPIMSEADRQQVEVVFNSNPQVKQAWVDYAKKTWGEANINYAMRSYLLQQKLKITGKRGQ